MPWESFTQWLLKGARRIFFPKGIKLMGVSYVHEIVSGTNWTHNFRKLLGFFSTEINTHKKVIKVVLESYADMEFNRKLHYMNTFHIKHRNA